MIGKIGRQLLVRVAPAVILIGQVSACGSSPGARPQPPSTSALTLAPRVTRFAGVLSGGLRVKGMMYPSIPEYSTKFGPNQITVTIFRDRRTVSGGSVSLVSKMIEMRMVPDHALLRPSGSRYVGRLVVPMFGTFRVTVTLIQGARTHKGFVSIAVPIP